MDARGRRRELASGAVAALPGPHASHTVKRRLASWSTLHHWKGIDGPFAAPSLHSAVRAWSRPRERKSKRAVTRDVLDGLIATCATDRLTDTRDPPLGLRLGWAPTQRSGGAARRRGGQGAFWSALRSRRCANGWSGVDTKKGPIFRAIDRSEAAEDKALTPESINRIVKWGLRVGAEGVFGARTARRISDRGGAARRGIALLEARQHSEHPSVQQPASYYSARTAGRQAGALAGVYGFR
jgi:hypothetical protein